MPSWAELERRFRELEPALRSARLAHQTGTEGEYWRIAAAFDMVAKSKFESLATIAGRKLKLDVREGLPQELLDESSDQVRWFRAIARNPRFYEHGFIAYPTNDKGERTGWIATGSINDPAAVSAAHCLEVAAMISEEEGREGSVNINISGQNARLNVGSVDNSSNVIASHQVSVFGDARTIIAERIEGNAREELLAKVNELEKAVNTPSYASRYREFMQTAADHVAVLGPVLARLAEFLG